MTSPSTSTGPVVLLGWYLASDLGRAAYHLLTRGLAPTVVGTVLFPGPLVVARALPWAAYVQVPADIWLGKRAGIDLLAALGFQALWATVLLCCCQVVLRAATRKVVVQGG